MKWQLQATSALTLALAFATGCGQSEDRSGEDAERDGGPSKDGEESRGVDPSDPDRTNDQLGSDADSGEGNTESDAQGSSDSDDSENQATDTTAGDNSDDGDGDGGSDTDEPVQPQRLAAAVTRHLSVVELQQTYQALLGILPEAMNTVPPDGLGYAFDRVVNGQTISRSHLEGFATSAKEAAFTLVANRELDRLGSACVDEIQPPPVVERLAHIIGAAMSVGPDWAVQVDDSVGATDANLRYAPEPTASYSHVFPSPGTYEVVLSVEAAGQAVDAAELALDGVEIAPFEGFNGATTLRTTLEVDAAGAKVLGYAFHSGNSLFLTISSLEVRGPIDQSGTDFAAQRSACVESLLDEFVPLAYRRPLAGDERSRLRALYDAAAAEEGYGAGVQLLLEAVLTNPNFLYVIEVGEPTEVAGQFKLSSWEVATRLSYAFCEAPPDAELRAAASSDELRTTEQVGAHAARLLSTDCSKGTVRRFFQHWLNLNKLSELNKSQVEYPTFTPELRAAMVQESTQYIEELFWNEGATLQTFLAGDYFWPNAETATLYGLSSGNSTRLQMPEDRAGALTLAGVLAVNSAFDESNPVLRGKFVLERLMCSLPPPPSFIVTPPLPDPNLTTRERWRAHSSDPACSACHEHLDPVGFALEGYDAIGRSRTEEHGKPIDSSGGLLIAGFEDGSLSGGAELAQAVASSEFAAACFAKHWLRFALGRLEVRGSMDDVAIEQLLETSEAGSLREVLLAVINTESFLHRSEEQ